MDNLGKALVMAGFAILFIVAATTSIYLYNSLYAFINSEGVNIGIKKRAEREMYSTSYSLREIDDSEILITLYNMKQMHVYKLTIKDGSKTYSITQENVLDENNNFVNFIGYLNDNINKNKKYKYSHKEVVNSKGEALIQVIYTVI